MMRPCIGVITPFLTGSGAHLGKQSPPRMILPILVGAWGWLYTWKPSWDGSWDGIHDLRMFPKIVGFSPQIIHHKIGWIPLLSPSILGAHPYFWKHPFGSYTPEDWHRTWKGRFGRWFSLIFLFQRCILRFHVNLPGCTFFFSNQIQVESNVWTPSWQTRNHDTVDGSEIRRSPVEVGCVSHYLQGLLHPNGGCLGFLPSTVCFMIPFNSQKIHL